MAITVVSGVSTPGANTKTTDLVNGTYQTVGPGTVTLYAKGSASGINATLMVGGVPLINDQPIIFYGTAGTMDKMANMVVGQPIRGGKIELFLRNTTATAGTTCDYLVEFTPGRG